MPLQVDTLRLNEEHEFGPADMGVSLVDEEMGLLITLYTYPAGSAAPSDQEFSAHFRDVVAEMAKSTQADQIAIQGVSDSRFRRPGLMAFTGSVVQDVPVVVVVMLFTNDRWYFKLRSTSPAVNVAKTRDLTLRTLAKSFNPCS